MTNPTQRYRYSAEYLYPGSFFPEETYRDLPDGHLSTALELAPDEEGYFKKDGWYAVRIRTRIEKRFVAEDGEETWIRQGEGHVKSYVIGVLTHVNNIHDLESGAAGDMLDNRILKSNIRSNSREPYKNYGVLTRCGNWQIASDWDQIIDEDSLRAIGRDGS